MATVMIRLKRLGTKKKPHNRVVVINRQTARDGRTLEEVGYYDASKNPPLLKMNVERIRYWLSKGAESSPTVKTLLKRYAAAQAAGSAGKA
ncbi:MAG: 30S ribosomal protein S16 [Candidatus Omnitrophica bacterium]|nr:30S ribosomal protein S16 [Candidatus Omnitrophota bacterium]